MRNREAAASHMHTRRAQLQREHGCTCLGRPLGSGHQLLRAENGTPTDQRCCLQICSHSPWKLRLPNKPGLQKHSTAPAPTCCLSHHLTSEPRGTEPSTAHLSSKHMTVGGETIPGNSKQQLGKILNYRVLTPHRIARYNFASSKSPQPDFAPICKMLLSSKAPPQWGFPGQIIKGAHGSQLPALVCMLLLLRSQREGTREKRREGTFLYCFYQPQIRVGQ